MSNFKHFALNERLEIECSIKDSLSFKAIARNLNKDCSTISKEIKKHITKKKTGNFGRAFNNCVHRYECNHSYICKGHYCKHKLCKFCSECCSVCSDFKEELCSLLSKPPYVCNGCSNRQKCTLEKSFYYAASAQKEYESLRSQSRQGINIDENQIMRLDNFISPLIKKGQSIHHICSNNIDTIMYGERTIYNYVNLSLFSARNIDLPRKVRYRPRKKSAQNFKVDKSCRINRTYDEFLNFSKLYPDTPVVEMDSVEGTKGGKVLLTIHFTDSLFMLAFIRDANTSQSVIDVFDSLYEKLGRDIFIKLFPIILTDNGSEFSNPSAIEFDKEGNRRSQIFYCDPSAPYQKGAAENNHEFIRRVIPKGTNLNPFSQNDILLMMNHINSYGRKKLNGKSPFSLFSFLHGVDTLKILDAECIQPNDIILDPSLLK
ncbi:MAG: IS30 family transposase [Sedimentibacter sp.]